MKFDQTVNTVTSNATFVHKKKMGIDEASIGHIFSVLTNIYSDAPKAIVQETTSNARDSHILAGQTKPVLVSFPTVLNPTFTVEDFGVGMSFDELNDIYSNYGASTKRDSNNQIGGFGLGAKAPLALVSSFTVIAVKNGKKNVVVISMDEEGGSSLNFLEETDTDAENGVKVSIPVPNVPEFTRVKNSGVFLGWEKDTILVDGAPVKSLHNSDEFIQLNNSGWFEHNAKRGYGADLRAVVGPVTFTIPSNQADRIIGDVLREKGIKNYSFTNVTRTSFILNLQIGTVNITPSRDNLIYSKKTLDSIKATLSGSLDSVKVWAEGLIAKANTHAEVIEAMSALNRNSLLPETKIFWKGQFIANNEGSYGPRFTFESLEEASENDKRIKVSNVLRTSTDIGYQTKNSRSSVGSPLSTKPIIIVEGTRNATNAFTVASSISAWYAATVSTPEGAAVKNTTTIYTTEKKESELDPFLIASSTLIITSDEVRRIAKLNRVRKTYARPAKAEEGAAPAVRTVAVTVGFTGNKKNDLVQRELETLAEKKIVVVQGDADGSAVTLGGVIYSYYRKAQNISKALSTAASNIIKDVRAQGYEFVVLAANADIKAVVAELPDHTDLETLLVRMLGAKFTPVELQFIGSQKGSWNFSLVSDKLFVRKDENDEPWINGVKNADTVEFFTLFRSDSLRGRELRAITSRCSYFGASEGGIIRNLSEDVDKAYKALVEDLKGISKRPYLLLEDGKLTQPAFLADSVDYINMVDARTK